MTTSTRRTEGERKDRRPIKYEVKHRDRQAEDKKDREEKVKRTESAGKWQNEKGSSPGGAA